jgi:hypothetical protein
MEICRGCGCDAPTCLPLKNRHHSTLGASRTVSEIPVMNTTFARDMPLGFSRVGNTAFTASRVRSSERHRKPATGATSRPIDAPVARNPNGWPVAMSTCRGSRYHSPRKTSAVCGLNV